MRHASMISSALLVVSAGVVPTASAATILVNGDFETGTLSSWSNSGGSTRAGLNGSTTAAFVSGGGNEIAQSGATAGIGGGQNYTLDMYFVAGLPGSAGNNSLEFTVLYQGDSAKGFLRFGVTNITGGAAGDLWVIDGASVKTSLFTDAITYSTDVGTGSEVLHPYRVAVTVDSVAGTYDVGLSNDGGNTFTQTALNQSIWVTNPTVTGFTNPTSLELKLIGGNTGGPPANQGTGVFDDVYLGDAIAIPEPSAISLLGLGALAMVRRRK